MNKIRCVQITVADAKNSYFCNRANQSRRNILVVKRDDRQLSTPIQCDVYQGFMYKENDLSSSDYLGRFLRF